MAHESEVEEAQITRADIHFMFLQKEIGTVIIIYVEGSKGR